MRKHLRASELRAVKVASLTHPPVLSRGLRRGQWPFRGRGFSAVFLLKLKKRLPQPKPGGNCVHFCSARFSASGPSHSIRERHGDEIDHATDIVQTLSYETFPTAGHVAYSRWKSPSTRACPPTPAALACWPETRCVPPPTRRALVAFTLVHRKGYFQQHLDAKGVQTEDVQPWNPSDFCTEEPARVTVSVEDRIVTLRAWRYDLVGRYGHIVPSTCSTPILKAIQDGIAASPIISTAATPTIACSRRLCWAWAACAWRTRSATK